MSNREAVIQYAVKVLEEMAPGAACIPIYERKLLAMSDEEFGAYMAALERKDEMLPLEIPNGSKVRISIDRNLALAEKYGVEIFQQLWLTDPQTGVTYLTPKKYMVLLQPWRRQIQLLLKKQSIPENNLHVDQLTDQPTGPSKGARISFPESQILDAQGVDKPLRELISFRGGDRKAYNYIVKLIVQEGSANHKTIEQLNTRVKSTDVLSSYLKAMHIDNNY